MFIKNKMKYKGEFNDDLPNGQGTLENFKDNSIYKGNVINGIKEGSFLLPLLGIGAK